MANYRNVSISFWTDSKVDDDFTPEDKYFYLYLLTNPHTNICGCYEISMKQMERETGYNTDSVKRLIHRMQDTHKVIRYDENTKEVLIVNWHKYNWSKSEKVKKAVLEVSEHIKSSELKGYVIDTLSILYQCSMETSVTDTVTETDTETDTVTGSVTENRECECADKPRRTRAVSFQPPTVEMVQAYCMERKNGIDAQRFVDFYTANGWMQGKGKPIRDWRATVRTWEQREYQKPVKPPEKTNQPRDSSFELSDFDKLVNRF